jgi:hypothetical protein
VPNTKCRTRRAFYLCTLLGLRDSRHFCAVGVPLLRRFETAVRSWAGANGLANMMLFGTPLEVQSAAAAPLM